MGSRYVRPTRQEFQELLKVEKGWKETTEGREICYCCDIRIPHHPTSATIKVFSSLSVSTQEGRGCGKDAIRICAVYRDNGFVRNRSVYRIAPSVSNPEGWIRNCRNAVMDVYRLIKERKWLALRLDRRMDGATPPAVSFVSKRSDLDLAQQREKLRTRIRKDAQASAQTSIYERAQQAVRDREEPNPQQP